jgi:hypothetical protein
MDELKIVIAEDFGLTPGGRWRNLGPYSGQAFYEDLLKPSFDKAVEAGVKLHVYLDGARSYPYSFLDQSFGQLARESGLESVKKVVVFHAVEKEWVIRYLHKEVWKDE